MRLPTPIEVRNQIELVRLVDAFIEEVDQMELMKDPSIRNPPSKHQRIIKEMYDLIQGFKHNVNVLKDEGSTDK